MCLQKFMSAKYQATIAPQTHKPLRAGLSAPRTVVAMCTGKLGRERWLRGGFGLNRQAR